METTETTYDVHQLIKQRWSPRSFSEKTMSDDALDTLFEAASWAASSMNEQPWKYIYAHRGTDGFERLADCLMDGNKVWAQNGAVLMLSLAKKRFDRNGQINRHAMHDTGAANTTLLLQAADDGILGHMMGGFHFDKTIEMLTIDADQWEPACFMVLGYVADPSQLEEPFRTRETAERVRNPIASFTEKI